MKVIVTCRDRYENWSKTKKIRIRRTGSRAWTSDLYTISSRWWWLEEHILLYSIFIQLKCHWGFFAVLAYLELKMNFLTCNIYLYLGIWHILECRKKVFFVRFQKNWYLPHILRVCVCYTSSWSMDILDNKLDCKIFPTQFL